MEIEINGELKEVVVQIEHFSRKTSAENRAFEYLCYGWLLKQKPVWSIAVYTDDALWQKDVNNKFWYGFNSENKKLYHYIDIIKIKREKSRDLIRKQSLMCKLLALKADDREEAPEELVREIYRAASEMRDELTDEKLLLIDQWVNAYKKISERKWREIQREASMEMIATTITEHVFNQGKREGKAEGKAEGKIEGRAEGKAEGRIEGMKDQIDTLTMLHRTGTLSADMFETLTAPLRKKLDELKGEG